ncbi:MAG: HAMP domain-containing protein [Tannerellaceae bacterium]|nr:HAMP domain-containing protein [Tannerellaceae bacterium]
MKIRTKLTLNYTIVTAIFFLLFVTIVYFTTEKSREKEFFHDLRKEAITKANLFLQNRVDAEIMQSIYHNNRQFLDEVEVAIYTTSFELLYHDAMEIDLVKETPEMIREIIAKKEIDFYFDKYQVVGFLYMYGGKEYVVTAAAYDGYGFAKQETLQTVLLVLWLSGMFVLFIVGYFLARGSLSPVSRIVNEVETLTASNLNKRIPVSNEKDEIGELAVTFNRILDRLEHSFDSQKMFVSNISHELRTPLAALISELEIALFKERTNEEYKQTLENILADSRKLVKLSAGLLDLAKASYDSQQITMWEIRLDELLLDARESVVKANPAYTVQLIFEQEAEDDSLITVSGNEYLLKTAFINLIENNCKFSDNQTSQARISFFASRSILRFSDTGIGLSEEDMKNIFTPFYRGTNKNYAQGNGIGMALVLKIITLHKGTIRVSSSPNEGTVFTVEIPHI